MMSEQTQQTIDNRVTVDKRLTMLRDACEMMRRSPDGLVRATTVSFKFDADLGEEEGWRTLSRSLAAEYGLREEVSQSGTWLTVRFCLPS